MRVYKLAIIIIDHEEIGAFEITKEILNMDFMISIISMECAEIGEWTDDHPLNKSDTHDKEIERLFNAQKTLSNT